MKTLVTLLLILSSTLSHCQAYVDLFKMSQSGVPGTRVSEGLKSFSPYNELTFDLLIPTPLNSSLTLLNGISSDMTWIHARELTTHRLYAVLFKSGINIQHSSQLSSTVVFLPKVAGSGNLNSKRLQLGGLYLMKRQINADFNLKWGIYSNTEEYGPLIVPILGMYLTKSQWEMNITLPVSAELAYGIKHSSNRVGLRFEGSNKSYNSHSIQPSYIEKTNNEVELFGERSVKNWLFRFGLGYAFGRSIVTYPSNERVGFALPSVKIRDNRSLLKSCDLSTPIAKFTLIYRLPINPQPQKS